MDRPQSSSLADVVEVILDKGLVIDAYVGVSVIGIEMLTIDARVVISSVDTYLRFAEATNRLDLTQVGGTAPMDLKDAVIHSGAKGAVRGAISGIKEGLTG
ncbi:gas vesicle protein GvpJ [Arthrobacter sp. H14]|uniref:gas vesicle protein GvpJ n=1 Tax=Arthrobacter sp. H14 TaxID=1312959 RepID=UPI0004B7C183|nr:gas vesicle protein GvpJ [Arthrobacter sp. H14]